HGWHDLALIHGLEGTLPLAVQPMRRAIRMARNAGLAPSEIDSLLKLADFFKRLGRWDDARAPVERARLLAGTIDAAVQKARVEDALAIQLIHRGEYAAAAGHAEAAVAFTKELGVPALRAVLRGTRATALYSLGSYDGALA